MLSGPLHLLFTTSLGKPFFTKHVDRNGRASASSCKAWDDLMLESISLSLGEPNYPWGQLGSGKVAEDNFTRGR